MCRGGADSGSVGSCWVGLVMWFWRAHAYLREMAWGFASAGHCHGHEHDTYSTRTVEQLGLFFNAQPKCVVHDNVLRHAAYFVLAVVYTGFLPSHLISTMATWQCAAMRSTGQGTCMPPSTYLPTLACLPSTQPQPRLGVSPSPMTLVRSCVRETSVACPVVSSSMESRGDGLRRLFFFFFSRQPGQATSQPASQSASRRGGRGGRCARAARLGNVRYVGTVAWSVAMRCHVA